jgi:hypothetical protein
MATIRSGREKGNGATGVGGERGGATMEGGGKVTGVTG